MGGMKVEREKDMRQLVINTIKENCTRGLYSDTYLNTPEHKPLPDLELNIMLKNASNEKLLEILDNQACESYR